MKYYFKYLYIVMILTVAHYPAATLGQEFDETMATAQARAFGPPQNVSGKMIGGVPVESIQWLLDRQLIRDVLTRYTRGLDRHDKILIASAFWPDAQINYGDTFTGLRDEFVNWSVVDDKKRFSAHTHNITNQTVEFDGDIAHVETYLIGIEHLHAGAVQVVGGRYIDRFEKRDQEWRIMVREFLIDTKGLADGDGFIPGKTCREACGRLNKSDLSYKRPLPKR